MRGNLFMNFAEIEQPVIDPLDSEKTVTKNVFAIFAHGNQVINKIKKISESMGGTLYSIDDASSKRTDALVQVSKRIQDLDIVSFNWMHFIVFKLISGVGFGTNKNYT